jgi:DNA gyrase subunit A
MSEEFSPEWRLRKAREREHVLVAVARAQAEWRDVLAVIEDAANAEAAKSALAKAMDLTPEQAMAVMDTQFRRVSKADRDRIANELDELRREIDGWEGTA